MLVPTWSNKKKWEAYIGRNPQYLQIFEKYHYKCADCKSDSKRLLIFSINRSIARQNLDNLLLLCRSCLSKRIGLFKSKDIVEKLRVYSDNKILAYGVLTIIARDMSLSRERVRQIAKLYGFVMAHDKENPIHNRTCKNCKKIFKSTQSTRTCCSTKCYKDFRLKKYWTKKKCLICDRQMVYRKTLSTIGKEPIFCCKVCQGKFFSKKGMESKRAGVKVITIKDPIDFSN